MPCEILHVDDSGADALVFREALKTVCPEARSIWVSRGEDALAFLREELAKLVVLDLNMPGMDGLEALRLIRSSPGMSLLPVVMLSSSRARRDIESAYSLGANEFLVKPMSWELFVEQVRDLVQRWLSPGESPSVPDVKE